METFHVAVSAGVASDFPTVPLLLRAIALLPRSCFTFYVSAKKLRKWFANAVKEKPARKPSTMKRVAVLAHTPERNKATKYIY